MNDATQQVVFFRNVSKERLIPYANDNLVLGVILTVHLAL